MEKQLSLRPFLSVMTIILTLFAVVFLQMEERRMGYSLLVLNRELKKSVEDKRAKNIQLARVTRPQHVEQVATHKLTLKKVQSNQIIYLTGADNQSKSKNKDM